MCMRIKAVGIFGYLLALVGDAMLLTSMGTTYWQQIPSNNNYVHSGLFEACSGSVCSSIGWEIESDYSITLIVTRSTLLVAVLFLLFGVIFALTSLCGANTVGYAGSMHITAGFFILIACGAYTTMTIIWVGYGNGVEWFGYSFYLCWGSGAATLMAGILQETGKKRRRAVDHAPRPRNAYLVQNPAYSAHPQDAYAVQNFGRQPTQLPGRAYYVSDDMY